MPTYQTPLDILIASADPKREILLRKQMMDYLNAAPQPLFLNSDLKPHTLSITAGLSSEVTSVLDTQPSTTAVTDLKSSSNSLYCDSLNVQTYVTTIQEQPIINLLLSNTSLSIPDIQNKAKQHATDWTGTYFPELAQAQADISDVCNNFDGFYAPLVVYANAIADPDQREHLATNVAGFKQGLSLLQNLIDGKGRDINQAITSLSVFTGNVSSDNGSFQVVKKEANDEYEGTQGEIALLQTQIDESNQRIANDTTAIGLASASEVVGGLMIAVGVLAEIETAGVSTGLIVAGIGVVGGGAAVLGVEIHALLEEQKLNHRLVAQLVDDKEEIAAIKTVVDVFTNLVDKAKSAIESLTNMGTHWGNLSAYYTNLSTYCDTVASQDPVALGAFLIGELNTMRSNFSDLKKAAQYCVDNATLPMAPSAASAKPLLMANSNMPVKASIFINSTVDNELTNFKSEMLSTDATFQHDINTLCISIASSSPPKPNELLKPIDDLNTMIQPFQTQSSKIKMDLDEARQTLFTTQQTLVNQMASLRIKIKAAQVSLSHNEASLREVSEKISHLRREIDEIKKYDGPLGVLINPLLDAIEKLMIEAKGYSKQISVLQAQVNSDSQNLNGLSRQGQAVQTQLNNVGTIVTYVTNIEESIEGLIAIFKNLIQNITNAESAPIAWVGPVLSGALRNWQDAITMVAKISPQSPTALITRKSLEGRINHFKAPTTSEKSERTIHAHSEVRPLLGMASNSESDFLNASLLVLTKASGDLYTTVLQVQVYVQTMLQQPDIMIPITGLDLATYQTTARKNAVSWVGDYFPVLLTIQANISAFCNTFTAFLPNLLLCAKDLSQSDNVERLQQGIALLQELLAQHLSDNNISLQLLNAYSVLINQDYTHYEEAVQSAETQYSEEGGELDQLRAQLHDVHKEMRSKNAEIAGAAVSEAAGIGGIIVGALTLPETAGATTAVIVTGVLDIVGSSVALGVLVDGLLKLQRQAQDLSVTISRDTQELAVLDNVTAQLSAFSKTTGSSPIVDAASLNQALNMLNTSLSQLSQKIPTYDSQALIVMLTNAGNAVTQLKSTAQQCMDNGYLTTTDNTAPSVAAMVVTSPKNNSMFARRLNDGNAVPDHGCCLVM